MRSNFISVRSAGPTHYPHSFRPKVILTDSNCVSSCKYLWEMRVCTLERIFRFFSSAICCSCWFFFHSFYSVDSYFIWYVSTHLWFTVRSYNDTKWKWHFKRYEFFTGKTMTKKKFDQIRSFPLSISLSALCECMSVTHSDVNVDVCDAIHS